MMIRKLANVGILSALCGSMFAGETGTGGVLERPDFRLEPLGGFTSLVALSESSAAAIGPPVPFSITVNFTGDAAFEAYFNDAAATLEALIPFYIDGYSGLSASSGLTIDASVVSIDGVGNILGQAGPTVGGPDNSGYVIATEGEMQFDADDFPSPPSNFGVVVLHEMAHVVGIGTLWDDNGLYDPNAASVVDPVNGEDVGRYLGPNGLAGWQFEYDQGAAYVPVEKGGEVGTLNAHWNEGDLGLPSGYVSAVTGEDSSKELMTGWLNPGSEFGNPTLGSFVDLGYQVTFVPESSSLALGLFGFLGLMVRRRR